MTRLLADPPIPGDSVVIASDDIVPKIIRSGSHGGKGTFRVLEIEHRVVPSTPMVRQVLNVADDRVLMVEQVGTLDDEPLYLRSSYFPLDVDPRTLSESIAALDLRDPLPTMAVAFESLFGRVYGGLQTTFEAVRCERRTAELLGIQEDDEILLREMSIHDIDGRVWDVSYTHYRSDRVIIENVDPADDDRDRR